MPTANLIRSMLDPTVPREVAERWLAEYALGIIDSVRGGELPLAQAAEDLFNLENYQLAKQRRLRPSLLEMLEWGMELEDVEELAPEGLALSYERMRKLASGVLSASAQ